MSLDSLYSFVFRGLLTEEALDTAGREKRLQNDIDHEETSQLVAINALDEELVAAARHMSIAYTAICAFENSVRKLIEKTLLEEVGEDWWMSSVSEKVRKSAKSRIENEEKIRWHGQRGSDPIFYTMLPDLLKIIRQNHQHFEASIANVDWAAQVFDGIERSRNVIMHSGDLSTRDLARVGSLIRDWNAQVGI